MPRPRERFPYSPLPARPRWSLPGGARVAVWTLVSVEEWDIARPMARTILPPPGGAATAAVVPDVPNWAWHEYGMRVGFWRLLDALARRKIRATTAVNANVCASYAPVAGAMRDAGWEFMGHGVVQAPMHLVPDERAAIRDSFRALHAFTGRKPRGWLGPGLAETWNTLDLLAEEGFEYVADWVSDDQPHAVRTRTATLVAVPYTWEIGDLGVIVGHHHSAGEWLQRARDHFDRLHVEGARQPRVMAVGLHAYIAGAPHRLPYVEALYDHMRRRPGVWLATGEEIHEWYRKASRAADPTPGPRGRIVREKSGLE